MEIYFSEYLIFTLDTAKLEIQFSEPKKSQI